jgi:hypothetical protein
MSWHADVGLLERYARGTLDDANAYSVEAHLLACDECRVRVPRDTQRLDQIWMGVRATMHAPRRAALEWILHRFGVREHTARLLAATPSLSASWLSAVSATLLFAVLASHVGKGTSLPFLLIAPVLPLAGVAAAYGSGVDPTYEMGAAAPIRGLRLLLIRAVAAFVTTGLLVGVGSLALPHLDLTAAAWVLPALGLTTTSLALSTWLPPVRSALIVSASWIIVAIVSIVLSSGPITVHTIESFTAAGQTVVAGLAVVSTLIVVKRGDFFERVTER